MTTVLPIGTTVCHACRASVAIVRRDVSYWCSSHGRVCNSPSMSLSVVDADGTSHLCDVNGRSLPCYDAIDGSSVISSDTIGNGRSIARPGAAAVPCLEGLAP